MEQLSAREEIWRGLLLGQRSIMVRLSATLKHEFGLSVPQFEALLWLLEIDEPMPTSVLGRRLLYSSGSTTHLVARLEANGWVSRDVDPTDARVVVVALTDSGRSLIERAEDRHRAEINTFFSPVVGENDVAGLLDFARRLAAHEGVTSQIGQASQNA